MPLDLEPGQDPFLTAEIIHIEFLWQSPIGNKTRGLRSFRGLSLRGKAFTALSTKPFHC
jgi:hypothetical protein